MRPKSYTPVLFLLISFVRNKAVLNSSPDLPLLFLLIQLVIAVILLQTSAFFTPKVEIPKFDLLAAKKLTPVVLVNIIGLVFNTLCLRSVEASFFQVCLRCVGSARVLTLRAFAVSRLRVGSCYH